MNVSGLCHLPPLMPLSHFSESYTHWWRFNTNIELSPTWRCRRASSDPAILGGSPQPQRPLCHPSAAMAWEQALQAGGYCPGIASFTPAFKALENICLILPLKPQHIVYASYYNFFFPPAGVGLCWLLLCWWCPTASRAFKAERRFLGCTVEPIIHS